MLYSHVLYRNALIYGVIMWFECYNLLCNCVVCMLFVCCLYLVCILSVRVTLRERGGYNVVILLLHWCQTVVALLSRLQGPGQVEGGVVVEEVSGVQRELRTCSGVCLYIVGIFVSCSCLAFI
jgi:hypothetical protein